jgi:hypothetical protein
MIFYQKQRRRAAVTGRRAGAILLAAVGSCWIGCGPGSAAGAGGNVPPGGTAAATAAASRTAEAGQPVDACLLMTPEDVQAVTGEVSGSLSSTLEDAVGRDPGQCAYPLVSGVPPRVISLLVRRPAGARQAAEQQEAAHSGMGSMSGAPVEEVPRLGDAAFWVGGQLDQLHVRSGATILIFTVQIDKDPARAARMLAGRALARLNRPAAPPALSGMGRP